MFSTLLLYSLHSFLRRCIINLVLLFTFYFLAGWLRIATTDIALYCKESRKLGVHGGILLVAVCLFVYACSPFPSLPF